MGVFGAGGIGLLILVARRLFSPRRFEDAYPVAGSGTLAASGRIQPRVTTDGFWLDAPDVVPGSVIRYRCRVNGEDQSGEFTVAPGPQGQFVYTGGTPSEVEVLQIIPPATALGMGLDQPTWPMPTAPMRPPRISTPPSPPPRPVPPSKPFTGYPSAY